MPIETSIILQLRVVPRHPGHHPWIRHCISAWFVKFEQFLLIHGLKDMPQAIWNADEAGFPLCPNSGKILALHNSKDVHNITGNSKDQITCLCAVNAAGEILPLCIFSLVNAFTSIR